MLSQTQVPAQSPTTRLGFLPRSQRPVQLQTSPLIRCRYSERTSCKHCPEINSTKDKKYCTPATWVSTIGLFPQSFVFRDCQPKGLFECVWGSSHSI